MANQAELIEAKEVDVTYVDFNQKLKIPEEPLVFKAQKLQIVLDKYEKVLQNQPNSFNMTSYSKALNEYCLTIEALKEGKKPSEILDSRELDSERNNGSEGANGDIKPISMGTGISPENSSTR